MADRCWTEAPIAERLLAGAGSFVSVRLVDPAVVQGRPAVDRLVGAGLSVIADCSPWPTPAVPSPRFRG